MARDLALLDRLARLYSAVVADVVDRLGYRHQIMAPDLRPLWPDAVVAGYAFPVQAVISHELAPEPYKLELESVETMGPGEVMVVAGAGREAAYWGELLSTRAKGRGCRGAIVDGLTRDRRMIERLGFPLFVAGYSPADSYGRIEVVRYGAPVVCGGVAVEPGDLVLGDADGIVVIPRVVAEEAIRKAEEKVRAEDTVRAELEAGASVVETFRRHGVM